MKNVIRIAALCVMLLPSVVYSQDDSRIVRFFTKLAEQGNVEVQYNLCQRYWSSKNFSQEAAAIRWCKKLAEQGFVPAQSSLGAIYFGGQGVPQDYITSHMWYNLAAANGDEDAVKNRDIVAGKMSQADVSEAQRRARVCMSSEYKDCE